MPYPAECRAPRRSANSDVSRPAHVRSAAEFTAEVRHSDDADLVADFRDSAMAPVVRALSMSPHHFGVTPGALVKISSLMSRSTSCISFRIERCVMREIEAKARGIDHAAGLLDVRSENTAQRRLQQVRCRVVAHRRRAAALSVRLRVSRRGCIERAP